MFGTVGEDYTTMESIRLTGGVAPDATWDENRRRLPILAQLAGSLHLRLVTFHAGFLPEDEQDPAFGKLVERLRVVADVFGEKGIELAFETGQETGESLRRFLSKLDRANVGVNFDPANMILYDKGEPVESLRVLARHVKQCHIKDATKTKQKGTWGAEVVVGTGEVDWPAFFGVLEEAGFNGYLAIEREAGDQRVKDIKAAKEFVLKTLASV
jgi:sugar phosphate isomerase/epimerase